MATHATAAGRMMIRSLRCVVALATMLALSSQACADIVIRKYVDKASPNLFVGAASGSHNPSPPPPPPPPPPPVGPPPALMHQPNLTTPTNAAGPGLRRH